MKKSLFLMLTVVLAIGLAAPAAFAVHPSEPSEQVPLIGKAKIELGGSVRIRGDMRNSTIDEVDVNLLTDDITRFEDTESAGFYDGRVRLHMNAFVTDNTMGRVQLETGSSNASDTYTGGCSGTDHDSAGIYFEGNCKKDELRVLEAWIQHSFVNAPITLKVGHMPLKLGRGLFFDHTKFGDDAIALNMKPNDMITVDVLTIKFDEGDKDSSDDDADAYVGIFSMKNDMMDISADVTYVNDKDFVGEQVLGVPGATVSEGTSTLWNIGVRGEVDVAGVAVYGDVELQTGTIALEDWDPASNDIDFGGWAFVVGADAKMGEVGLNGEFGMGSGQGEDDFDDDEYNQFVTALSGIQKFTYVYDYRMVTAAIKSIDATTGTATAGTNTGIANTTYIKVGADTKATPDLYLAGELYWLMATEDVVFNDANGSKVEEDNIGWEVDARAKYNIDKNLQYFIEGGVLFTGDLYDELSDAAGGEDADTAYVVRHGIQLSF